MAREATRDCVITDNRGMSAASDSPISHLLIPYAWASAEPCAPVLQDVALPNLRALLESLQPGPLDEGSDYTLSPPHERALGRALGLCGPAGAPDGQWPWAAWEAGLSGVACAWFTPCHWQVGMERVSVQPPDELQLTPAHSLALLEALRPFAAEDGLTLTLETPDRWRAEGECLRGLPCASLDRVAHRDASGWLLARDAHPAAPMLLRLQNEAQMLFYTHPVNDERAAQGLGAVNGVWISGSGVWDGTASGSPPTVPHSLRQPALHGDWPAWARAWQALDAGPLADLLQQARAGARVALTLCGERHAQTWRTPLRSPPWWRRAALNLGWLNPAPYTSLLSAL